MDTIEIVSPDQRKSILLDYQGEARFGPAFFRGRSVGFPWPLRDVLIGEDVHWSADSRFAVVLVFHSRDTAAPPDVELIAIDTVTGTLISIARDMQGLIYPKAFTSNRDYEYIRVVLGNQTTEHFSLPK